MTKINNVQHGDLGLSTTVNITKPNLEIKAIAHTSKRFDFEFLKLGKSYNVHRLEQRQREREYQMIEQACIYGRRDISRKLPHINIRTTPASSSPTPNEIAIRVLSQLGSRSAYCEEGILSINGSTLQAAIAVNKDKREIILVLNREKKAVSLKSWLNKATKSQSDYLYASNIAQELVKVRNKHFSDYAITITGEQKESKLINYVLTSAKKANA
ncbi:hypothetical protein [Vibrio parahaemolyticus]|uniref:hypothetical protein n=1 Tax=Vibrio parahaemolyticus TaxID=670 RepID=UPI0004161454|nr:hypothetical protein [Vibrio parahaemolyticus]ANB97494.1 hypothetical protein FORC14_1147 [Vibrio parahaemolyticus]EIA0904467.1 hypothetical protein [Vibrio parahaemolyticus]EIK4818924.1 hypothetical protein [Vibrio parahaemolyticus]EJG1178632.1 hypothetical protein [Vibrio parahaemolyticus]MBE5151580.1 hypothetical protein [Vibrio parahaemolyticus]